MAKMQATSSSGPAALATQRYSLPSSFGSKPQEDRYVLLEDYCYADTFQTHILTSWKSMLLILRLGLSECTSNWNNHFIYECFAAVYVLGSFKVVCHVFVRVV